MSQLKIILSLLLLLLSLAGCTVCSTCHCEKDGESFTEMECATGIGQRDGLETWQRLMIEEKEYDGCACITR